LEAQDRKNWAGGARLTVEEARARFHGETI